MSVRQLVGDCRVQLATLEAGSAQCCITSPPYWGLRDYGTPPLVWGQTCCEHAHEWGTAVPGDAKGGSGSFNGRNGAGEGYARGAERGAFCTHVHDWGAVVRSPWANSVPGPSENHPKNGAASHWTPKVSGQLCPCGAWLGSLGLEPDPAMYVEHIVECFRHVRRVLRDDSTLWVNLGDSYAGSGNGAHDYRERAQSKSLSLNSEKYQGQSPAALQRVGPQEHTEGNGRVQGYKPKDLMMIPFRVAMALQADGWWLRSVIPWLKRNSMPESCRDRPSTSVEYVFLLSKSSRYYFDADAVRVTQAEPWRSTGAVEKMGTGNAMKAGQNGGFGLIGARARAYNPAGRNRRNSDWWFESWQGLMLDEQDEPLALVVNPQPFKESHFATFPPKLVEPMVKASTRPGDVILDPFSGAGTVLVVADHWLGRNAIGCELKPEYGAMATNRLTGDAPMFVEVTKAPA